MHLIEDLVFGRVLAELQLGRNKNAAAALRRAKKAWPLVALELVKSRHTRPENWNEERISLGGADQAYAYWKENAKYWRSTASIAPRAVNEVFRRRFWAR